MRCEVVTRILTSPRRHHWLQCRLSHLHPCRHQPWHIQRRARTSALVLPSPTQRKPKEPECHLSRCLRNQQPSRNCSNNSSSHSSSHSSSSSSSSSNRSSFCKRSNSCSIC